MVEIAMPKLGIRDVLRLNPLPVQAFADDIVLPFYGIEALHPMLHASKCAIFCDRRSGNNWYKGRKIIYQK